MFHTLDWRGRYWPKVKLELLPLSGGRFKKIELNLLEHGKNI